MRTVVNASERFRSTPDPEEWLTVPQVAERLRCGRTTVFRLLGDGTLPSVRPGRARLVKRTDVDSYLEQLRAPTR